MAPLTAKGLMLRARALVEVGRFEEAAQHLTELVPHPRYGEEALIGLVRARLSTGHSEDLSSLVRILAELIRSGMTRPKAATLKVIDHILAEERPLDAVPLLKALDSYPETRGGDVLERMALVAALLNDRPSLEEALERAEAFLEDGGVQYIRILYAIEDRAWTRLPRLVIALRQTNYKADPVSEAILTLLEERLEVGTEQARLGAAAAPDSAVWVLVHAAALHLSGEQWAAQPYLGAKASEELGPFLRGVVGASRDPREILALLLAARRPGWALWALPRIAELSEKGGGELWPGFAAAYTQAWYGRADEALSVYERLNSDYPHFGPAWDERLRLGIASHASPFEPELLRLRAARRAALGEISATTGLTKAIEDGAALVVEGHLKEAAKLLKGALDAHGDGAHPARLLLAQTYERMREYRLAVDQYIQLLTTERSARSREHVRTILKILDEARDPRVAKRRRMEPRRVMNIMGSLEDRFPNAPLIPLERVRAGLTREQRNPTLAVEMALTVFKRFRRRTQQAPLDSLDPGSSSAWAELLMGLAPEEAEAFLLEDLSVTPGNIDLWHQLAAVYELRGMWDEALQVRAAVVAMCPEAHALSDYAWLLFRTGSGPVRVNKQLTLAQAKGSGDAKVTDRASVLRVLAQIRHSGRKGPRETLLQRIEGLWKRRGRMQPEQQAALGRGYATAVISQGRTERMDQLPTLLEEFKELDQLDAYDRDYVTALQGLAPQLRRALLLREESQKEARDVDPEPADEDPVELEQAPTR